MDVYRVALSHFGRTASWVVNFHFAEKERPAADLPARSLADAFADSFLDLWRACLSRDVRFGSVRVWRHWPAGGLPWFYPLYADSGERQIWECAPSVSLRLILGTTDTRAFRSGSLALRGVPYDWAWADVWAQTLVPDPLSPLCAALAGDMVGESPVGGRWHAVYRSTRAALQVPGQVPWFPIEWVQVDPIVRRIKRPETADQVLAELPV